jgi:hypothetical protein
MSQSQVSKVERGLGRSLPFEFWISLGMAIDRPLRVELSRLRDGAAELTDAGHLAAQEFLLRLLAGHAWRADFELPTRSTQPARSIDVAGRHDVYRRLAIFEIWNRIGDLGASARTSERKVADLRELAIAQAHGGKAYAVSLAWLILPTAANRSIVRSYPAIFRARFPGSSRAWAEALMNGGDVPDEPAALWIDSVAKRVTAIRLRGD